MIIDRRSLLPLERSSSLLGLGGGAMAMSASGDADGCNTLELPLSFHNASSGGSTSEGRTRLFLDDNRLTVTPIASPSVGSGGSAATVEHLRGLASAECHTLPNDNQKVMVTTAADPDRHLLLMVEARTGSNKAASIELDLSGLTQFEGTRPVKVKTFLHPTIPDDAYVPSDVTDDARHNMARFSDDAAGRGVSYDMGNFGRPYGYGSRGDKVSLTLRVVMVDTAGTIVTVFLSYENGALVPVSRNASIRGDDVRPTLVHSIPSLVASSAPHLYLTPGTTLSTSDVDFLTPNRLVVALSPHLLCVDVVKDRVVAWTMAVGRRSTIGTIFSQATSLLVGEEVDDDEYIEESVGGSVGASADGEERMPPVSALTVVKHQAGAGHGEGQGDQDEEESDTVTTTVVFTLHADGSLRLWFCGTKLSLLPKKVRMIRVPGEIAASALMDQDNSSGAGGILGLLSARKAPRQKKVQHPGEDPPLPEPNTWSTDADAVMISGKLYEEESSTLGGGISAAIDIAADDGGLKVLRYALAVSVRTVEDPLADLEFAEQENSAGVASPGGNNSSRVRSPSFSSTSGIGSPNHSSRPQRRSACHVLVLSGEADGKAGLAGNDGAVPLIVPGDARNVVDLDFSLDDGELHALFSTGFDADKRRYLAASALGSSIAGDDVDIAAAAAACSTGSIFAVYPSSTSTVVSHSSLSMGAASTIDFTALAERDSIIDLRDGLRADIEHGAYATIEEATAAVDRACMTKLFRGCAIRSAGGTQASSVAIERAISRLVPSSSGLLDSGAAGSRVDVLALLAIQEWTRFEEAHSTLLAVGRQGHTAGVADTADGDAAGSDIYRAFAKTPSKGNSRVDRNQMELTYEEEENEEMERKKKSLAHLSRWIKFLLAVFEEESIRREVLCLASLSTVSSAPSATVEASMILRGGMTSILAASQSPSSQDNTAFGRLDALATKVLRHLQLSSSDNLSTSLRHDVHRITSTVAKAGLVMSKLDQDLVESLAFLGASALNEIGSVQSKYGYSTTPDGATAGNIIATVTSLLDALSEEEISQWLSPSSAMNSPIVRPFQLGTANENCMTSSVGIGSLTARAMVAEDVHSASSSAYLSHLFIDSVRDLSLARCLLVLGTKRLVSAAAESAKAASVMMGRTAGAIIGGDTTAITATVENEELVFRALRAYFQALSVQWAASQKLETGSVSATSIDSSSKDTAPVRSETHVGARPRVEGETEAMQSFTVLEAVCFSLAKASQGASSVGRGKIAALSMASSAVDVSKLFVDLAYRGGSGHTNISQLAMLGPFTDQARIALRLLAPFVAYPEEYGSISQIAAECLLREATFAEANRTLPEDRVLALRERASAILLECDIDPSTIDVLNTIHDATESVHECALLYNRGAVLERHCSGSIVLKANLELVTCIGALQYALKEGGDEASTSNSISELEMLKARTISSAFQHAMISNNYEKAYDAAISNPIKERRLSCFKRLVLGIADAGAFHQLLSMPLTVVGRPNGNPVNLTAMVIEGEEAKVDADTSADEIDLYELAAEVLANAASEQSRSSGIRGVANYSGCLYALHSSRNNWRRAAAAMAFSGTLASAKAAASSSDGGKREEGMAAVDSVALSALAAAHSIQLEDNPSHRFIVRNEVSQYPVPPSFREAMDDPTTLSSKKRGRDGHNRLFGQEISKGSPSASRSARLMLEKDLIADAIRAVSLRTVLLDQTNSEADLLDTLQANDRVILDQLASQGNFTLALGLANALYDDRNGEKPQGRDIFADALSYVLCQYLVPAAINDRMSTSISTEGEQLRPTLSQIRSSAEVAEVGHAASVALPSVDGWKGQAVQAQMAQAAACMDLLRIYTTKYANSSNSLAIEVATTLLDSKSPQGGVSQLPVWLTDLLCGTNDSCFAGRVSPGDDRNGEDVASGAASPSALVKIYIERARYAEACEVVAKVLDDSGSRVSSPSARLPEEGSIDFVPYNTIDQLHSIIASARFTSEEVKAKVLASRAKMEEALERHFERMRISEEGAVSARALGR